MEKENSGVQPNEIRRKLLQGAVITTAAAAGGQALADKHSHAHHSSAQHAGLVESALSCIDNGNTCMSHCLQLFKTGDTSVADCAASVNEMLTMCNTLVQLAANNSTHLPAFAEVCKAACEDCEKECQKHKNHHTECKACAESCASCIDECKKITA